MLKVDQDARCAGVADALRAHINQTRQMYLDVLVQRAPADGERSSQTG